MYCSWHAWTNPRCCAGCSRWDAGTRDRSLTYTKTLGQLQDAENTTTLAHYLELLAGAGMITGLQKYTGDVARSRESSPKFQVLNTAL